MVTNNEREMMAKAAEIVAAAGEAGGLQYVTQLATSDWSDVELDGGSLELRAAIKVEAARIVSEEV